MAWIPQSIGKFQHFEILVHIDIINADMSAARSSYKSPILPPQRCYIGFRSGDWEATEFDTIVLGDMVHYHAGNSHY